MTPHQEFIGNNLKQIGQIVRSWGFQKKTDLYNSRISEVIIWFDNFKPSELKDALLILSKIQYIQYHKIKGLIEIVSNEIDHIFGKDFDNVLFFPLGSFSASSGSMYLYEYYKTLGLTSKNFKQDSFISYLDTDISIVFIDDIIGSGRQATKFFNEFLINKKAKCYYFTLFGFESGLEYLNLNANFELVLSAKILSDEEMAFGSNSYVFKDLKTRNRLENLCEKYGSILFPKHPLGYDNSQSLLVFPHNAPNNTLPIIWASTFNEKQKGVIWRPIWERKKFKEKKPRKSATNSDVGEIVTKYKDVPTETNTSKSESKSELRRKEIAYKELIELEELVSEWKQKLSISQIPSEKKHCKLEIQRLNQMILEVEQRIGKYN
ncbi:hypothetical protein FEE95_21010 [Maribacter algarum]|uniref:PRTase-CE domain-containing protein n=1 Tax=Maribacter algarum (ex Zhang et al. 2020) TaxID=2578118 RepID=A0A5S3Q5X8_9FLAO|nr:hypothetical protein [Maribacter algarum]TMM52171.1 hypothetical protein FEE95_21010 [Maribacter algarum]